MKSMPKAHGLYDPAREHDACGIGAIVNISGRREHRIVELGKTVLLNLMHRGAAGADEATGDGAGILMQLPHELILSESRRLGIDPPPPGHYAVAMVFLPQDPDARGRCENLLAEALAEGELSAIPHVAAMAVIRLSRSATRSETAIENFVAPSPWASSACCSRCRSSSRRSAA